MNRYIVRGYIVSNYEIIVEANDEDDAGDLAIEYMDDNLDDVELQPDEIHVEEVVPAEPEEELN